MFDPDRLIAFALIAFPLIVVPGPSVMFVIGRGLALGRRGALATVLGNAGGLCVEVVVVAIGVGALVAASELAFAAVRIIGAAYLAFLGLRTILGSRSLAAPPGAGSIVSDRKAARDGFVVGATNPKALLFFAAVLPQFVNRGAGYVPVQMLALGLIFVLMALLTDSLWAIIAAKARGWFADSPRVLGFLTAIGGAFMIVLAAIMLTAGREG